MYFGTQIPLDGSLMVSTYNTALEVISWAP